jgi:hypothetical protein
MPWRILLVAVTDEIQFGAPLTHTGRVVEFSIVSLKLFLGLLCIKRDNF